MSKNKFYRFPQEAEKVKWKRDYFENDNNVIEKVSAAVFLV